MQPIFARLAIAISATIKIEAVAHLLLVGFILELDQGLWDRCDVLSNALFSGPLVSTPLNFVRGGRGLSSHLLLWLSTGTGLFELPFHCRLPLRKRIQPRTELEFLQHIRHMFV